MKKYALNHIIETINKSILLNEPSPHFEFSNILPIDLYTELLERFPSKECFQPLMHQDAMMKDGGSSRGEIYLSHNELSKLDEENKIFWLSIGDIFRSETLRKTLQDKLGLKGSIVAKPSLYQDRSGYQIRPHTDISTKAITMQIYLPNDTTLENYGTTFYSKEESSFIPKKTH